MNIFISQQQLSARFIAAVSVVALLLSALPASFFVAEAEVAPTFVIEGHKYECVDNGDGYDCDRPLADWAIYAQNANTMDRVYTTTSASGAYSITVPAGIWEVYEVPQDNWEMERMVRNGVEVSFNTCRFNFGDVDEGPLMSLVRPSIAIAADETADGTCDFGNKRTSVQPVLVKLCKYTPGADLSDPVPVAGWKMRLTTTNPNEDAMAGPEDSAPESLVTGADGCVTTEVNPENGRLYAYEESVAGWELIDLEPTNGEFNAEGGTPYCSFFGEEASFLKKSSEDIEYRCNFYNRDIRKAVTGFKYSDSNNNGVKDEGEAGVAGWAITATDLSDSGAEAPISTVTGADGSYTLLLPPEGIWQITEETRSGWTQTAVIGAGENLLGEAPQCTFTWPDERELSAKTTVMDEEIEAPVVVANSCDFLNYQTPRKSSGGGYGGRIIDRTPTPTPTGEVLGASTSTPQCSVYLDEYMRQGKEASSTQVLKLQIFLNAVGIKAPLTGIFDNGTDASVRTFQAKHKAEVLTPWYVAKIVPHENPTGWVYQLTRWKINNIVCPGSEAYPVLN